MNEKNEKIFMSMKVKVNNTFKNPLNGRMLVKGEILSVPKERFWFKRIKDGDVEKVELAPKAEKKIESYKKESKKGSK